MQIFKGIFINFTSAALLASSTTSLTQVYWFQASTASTRLRRWVDAPSLSSDLDSVFLEILRSYIIGQVIDSVRNFHVNQLAGFKKGLRYVLLRLGGCFHENEAIFLCEAHPLFIRNLPSGISKIYYLESKSHLFPMRMITISGLPFILNSSSQVTTCVKVSRRVIS